MPYIHAKVSTSLGEREEKTLKTELGKAIRIIPGKSEQWLMTAFEGDQHMYFRGDNARPCAFVEVLLYGGENAAAFDKMTGEITRIFSETLGIEPDHIYVAYQTTGNWGWNGGNF
ncbi:MAG: hypothetical protein IKQ69_10290 [Oscillospiraceae bacterium]|nr:hypothetical protein [Oscillospiraceae bacterium]MBR6209376.1 hypothetical protein [Oscillospiraceae bacterium]